MTSQVPTGWKPEYPFEQIKPTLRQETLISFDTQFGRMGPEGNSDSIGRDAGCDDCAKSVSIRQEHRDFVDTIFTTLTEKIEGMKIKVGDQHISKETEGWYDAGARSALDSVLNLLK